MNMEDTSSKAMVDIDRAALKTQPDNLRVKFNKSEFNLATYKRGLASVEEQLVFYKKNEVMFCDQIAVLKRDASFKDSEIIALKSEIEKLKKEKECNQIKINKFENASKCLEKLIGSQISDNSRKGVGYNAVPPPPTGLFAPPTIDLSNSGLEEFQQLEFKGYGPKASKSVYVDTSNEDKKTSDTPLVEELVLEKEKQTVFPKQQDKTVRKPVKPKAVNTARPNSAVVNTVSANQANVVKASACWVRRPTKLDSASITLKKHNYIDARGRSKYMTGNISYLLDFQEFDGGYVTFGGGVRGGKITGKGLSIVGDEAVHKELGDRMERAATTDSSLETEQDSATARTTDDGEVEITASIDGQVKTIPAGISKKHLSKPRTKYFLARSLMVPKFKGFKRRCHNHDLFLEALDNKQIEEDFIMSSIEIVYKLEP
ncbi:hypothetical protein Tco_0379016 [Tanacetum coccineum]